MPGTPPPGSPLGPPPARPPAGWPTTPPPVAPPRPPTRRRGDRAALLSGAIAAAIVLVAAAVVVPILLADEDEDRPVTLADVQVFEELERFHTEEDVDYPQSPPVGGPHAAAWLDCGTYDAPVREENVVHDLEHGTVWITHDPGLPDDDVAALAEQLPANGILSPYDGLAAPVVVTVWGRQLELDGADDPRLELFVEELGAGETAPEPFASCAGGLTDPDGEPGRAV